MPTWRTTEALCYRGLKEVCARERVSGRRMQAQVASWAKARSSRQRGGGGAHRSPFHLFGQRFSEPSSLYDKSSHRGKNVFPFNLKNYRRREERVSSNKLGAGLAWLVALPINIGLPGLETQRSGLLEAIGEHPSWSSVRELTACTNLHASA